MGEFQSDDQIETQHGEDSGRENEIFISDRSRIFHTGLVERKIASSRGEIMFLLTFFSLRNATAFSRIGAVFLRGEKYKIKETSENVPINKKSPVRSASSYFF